MAPAGPLSLALSGEAVAFENGSDSVQPGLDLVPQNPYTPQLQRICCGYLVDPSEPSRPGLNPHLQVQAGAVPSAAALSWRAFGGGGCDVPPARLPGSHLPSPPPHFVPWLLHSTEENDPSSRPQDYKAGGGPGSPWEHARCSFPPEPFCVNKGRSRGI